MMEDEGLDCLDLLEETPGTLRGLMRELSHEDAAWKPAARSLFRGGGAGAPVTQ
jgi:hypothetical protein